MKIVPLFTWPTRRRISESLDRMMAKIRRIDRRRRQVFRVYHGGVMAVHGEVTIELSKYVGSFPRVKPRSFEWYQRAAERYVTHLARHFDWVYQTPEVELVRIMDWVRHGKRPMGELIEMAKCVVVKFRAAANPGIHPRLLPDILTEARYELPASSAWWAGSVTGRLSCHEPEMQNIPVRTKLGDAIRRSFGRRAKEKEE